MGSLLPKQDVTATRGPQDPRCSPLYALHVRARPRCRCPVGCIIGPTARAVLAAAAALSLCLQRRRGEKGASDCFGMAASVYSFSIRVPLCSVVSTTLTLATQFMEGSVLNEILSQLGSSYMLSTIYLVVASLSTIRLLHSE